MPEGPIPRTDATTELDPCVRALLPVLLHELNNQTQLLLGLHAAADLEGADELFRARAGDLARAGARTRELGYALAVIGSALGADLLLARREGEGARWMLALVELAARRRGVPCDLASARAPRLSPRAPDGWRAPWALAALAWWAVDDAAESGAAARAEWVLGSDGSVGLALAPWRVAEIRADRCAELAPGAELEQSGARAIVAMPAAWFAAE